MSQGHNPQSMNPRQPLSPDAEAFSTPVHSRLDGRSKDDATLNEAVAGLDQTFDLVAAGMYNLASILVGEGEEGVRLVERAVSTAEVPDGETAAQDRENSPIALCKAALQILAERNPESLAAPEEIGPAGTCIDDQDLDAAGVSSQELGKMLAGPDRDRVRSWLASLSTTQRLIFGMRAVAGLSPQETAGLLAEHGGPQAEGWTRDSVRVIFRQALCSLASQLLHETTSR